MAKCLLYKYKGLHFSHSIHVNKLSTVIHACVPGDGKVEMGILWDSMASYPGLIGKLQVTGKIVPKKIKWVKTPEVDLKSPHIYIHVRVYTHPPKYIYIHTHIINTYV